MELKQALSVYNKTTKILKAFEYVEYLNSWDIQTEAPIDSIKEKNIQMEYFSNLEYEIQTGKEYQEAINCLYQNKDKLDFVMQYEITKVKENIDKIAKIPQEEYVKYGTLLNNAYMAFVEAKNNNDFLKVKPFLNEIIEYKKKYIVWQKGKLTGYNILLNEYEEGTNVKMYDEFFDLIKQKLIPLIKIINQKKLNFNRKVFEQKFDVEKQKQFSQYLKDVLCMDKNKFVIKQSEHPFTTNFTNKDVRITNHYHEDILNSAIFSDIHEMGHALYELQVDDSLNYTNSSGGASMAMHESQSRFMENIIGRSYEFWEVHFSKLKELFSTELKDCTIKDFYNYVNESQCDFIRTEADELTYPIHILIRYEIEKGIFENKYQIDDLPKVWNNLYKEYLGLDVKEYKKGILQDVHWYGGDFGYFPTYALGSAYSCQILNSMQKDFDVYGSLKQGNIRQIANWLKENIHTFDSSKSPKDILEFATKEKFNPNYYIDYLVNKYKKLYEIE